MRVCARAIGLFLIVILFFPIIVYSQTITNPRAPAEFEEVKGVVIRWDEKEYYQIFSNIQGGWTTYWRDRYNGTINTQLSIVRETLNEGLDIYVIDDTSHTSKYGGYLYSDYHVADTLTAWGISSSPRLHIIPYPALDDNIEKVWIRDWGQYNIYKNGVDSISIVGRSLDTTIGKYLQKPFITSNVMDGGNFMMDGHGRLICDAFQTNISQSLFGINDLVTVANYKIHVDYYMKLINEETFVVSEVPYANHLQGTDTFYGDSTALEGAIAIMKQKTSCFGRPYKFIRIKSAPTYNQGGLLYYTSDAGYINSLILNRTVLVPTYDNPATDTVAINTYKKVMSGYQIIGIPARYYAARQGAIHCITKELAVDNPIFIAHAWLPDTTQNNQGQYQIKAYIKTPPGVSHAEVNWTTNPQSGFQSIAMTQTVGDTFVAYIPGQPSGNILSYYISATANGGKQVVKPVVAPSGYYSTYLKATTQLTAPTLIGWTGYSSSPSIYWTSSIGANHYWLQVASDQNFTALVYDYPNLTNTIHTVGQLNHGMRYYSRVAATDGVGMSQWSNVIYIDVDTTTHHYEYTFPDGRIYVYDIDIGHALIDSVIIPAVGIRGVVASPSDGMLYISYGGIGGSAGNGSMLQYSILRDSLGWVRNYSHGIDSHSILPDGTTIFMPTGSLSNDGKLYVVNTTDGSERDVILTPARGGHNTAVSLDGAHVYMGDRDINYIGFDSFYVVNTANYQIEKKGGRFSSSIRPFTINGSGTFAFVNTSYLLGFQVCNLVTGKIAYTVDLTTMGFPKTNCGTCETVSHGISLSPDEREVYVVDAPNGYVHVFDVSRIFENIPPQKVADIPLQHPLTGSYPNCTGSCLREGWLQHSGDGRFVYVGDAGDVINTATRTVVTTLPSLQNTRKMLEVDWKDGRPISTTSRIGIGHVINHNAPSPPSIVSPINGAARQPTALTLRWNASNGAASYRLQVADNSSFASALFDQSGITQTSQQVSGLSHGTRYYWRLNASDAVATSSWSDTAYFVVIGDTITQTVNVRDGWNMISLPLVVADPRKAAVLPTAISNAFAYQGYYIIKDTLKQGIGYWAKFLSNKVVQITGTPTEAETIDVHTGWNLIGSITTPVPVTSIQTIPPTITSSNFFGYNLAYTIADTIQPSKGYWIKVSSDGKLILSSLTALASKNRLTIIPTSELPPASPLSESVPSRTIPHEYSLAQNYPNPFNPSTSISFSIPKQSYVRLQVFTPLGQLIETLVDEEKQQGIYTITWNLSGRSTGIYFYKLIAGEFTQTRKMAVVK